MTEEEVRVSSLARSLEQAASQGQVEAISALIRDGASASVNAIKAAVDGGYTSILRLLVQSLDADAKTSWIYEDALPRASARGHVETVEYLLSGYSSSSYGVHEQSGLQAALFHCQVRVLDVFIARFPSMRGISRIGGSFATIGRVPNLLPSLSNATESLVPGVGDTGSSIDVRDHIDKVYATTFGCDLMPYPDSVDRLDGAQTMRLAARLGEPRIIDSLAKAGHAVGMQDDHDTYNMKAMPIEVAAAYGHTDAVAMFLDHGSEPQRALVFAVRFRQLRVVQFLLERFPAGEVDLEKVEFLEKIAQTSQMDKLSNRNADEEGSSMRDLVDRSALALAVELGDLELVKLLMDHKSKTGDPMPTLALSRATRDDRMAMLTVLFQSQHLWDTEEVWIPQGGYRPSREKTELDILQAKDRFFRLHGQQRTEEPHSIFHETMKIAARAAGSVHSYRAVKVLIDNPANTVHRDMLTIEAAEVNPSIELLDACSISGPRGASLLQIGLLSSLKMDQESQRRDTRKLDGDAMKTVLKNISDLCVHDSDLLDEMVVEISSAAVSLKSLDFLEMTLRICDPARKPLLRSSPDLLSQVLLQHHQELPSSVPHLLPMACLLLEYGSQLAPALETTAVALACMNGWASLFFYLIQNKCPLPSPQQKFCHVLLKSHLWKAGIDWASHKCTCANPLDLLTLTMHGLSKSNYEPTAWISPLSPGYGDVIVFLLRNGFSLDLTDPMVVQFCQIICFQGDEALFSEISKDLQRASVQRLDDDLEFSLLDSMGLLQAACLGAEHEIASRLLRLGASATYKAGVSLPRSWTNRWDMQNHSKWTPVQLATDVHLRSQIEKDNVARPHRLGLVWGHMIRSGVSQLDEQRMLSSELLAVDRSVKAAQQTMAWDLLFKGVDVNEANRVLPFVESLVRKGRTDWIRLLVSKHGLDLNTGERYPMSLINAAVREQHVPMLTYLLSQCREHCDDQEMDTLTDATLYDGGFRKVLVGGQWDSYVVFFEIVKRKGYDINKVNREAKFSGQTGLLTLLGKFCVDEFDVSSAALERLLEHGADPNESGTAGHPLIILLSHGQFGATADLQMCIERLISAGADPNLPKAVAVDYQTAYEYPIHLAASWKDPIPILKLLVKSGVDYNADGGFGTPLFQARVRAYYKGYWKGSRREALAFLEAQPGALDKPGQFSFAKNGDSVEVITGMTGYRQSFAVEAGDPFFQIWQKVMPQVGST